MFKQHYAACTVYMFPKGFNFIFRSTNPKIGTTCSDYYNITFFLLKYILAQQNSETLLQVWIYKIAFKTCTQQLLDLILNNLI